MFRFVRDFRQIVEIPPVDLLSVFHFDGFPHPQKSPVVSHKVRVQNAPAVADGLCFGGVLVCVRLYHGYRTQIEGFSFDGEVRSVLFVRRYGKAYQFFGGIGPVLDNAVPVLQISKFPLTGHFDIQIKVLVQLGHIPHKNFHAVFLHRDHGGLQGQLVVIGVYRRDGEDKGTEAVLFQRQFRLQNDRQCFIGSIVQSVPFGPIVAGSVRIACDLPDVHRIALLVGHAEQVVLFCGRCAVGHPHGQLVVHAVLAQRQQCAPDPHRVVGLPVHGRVGPQYRLAVQQFGHGHLVAVLVVYAVCHPEVVVLRVHLLGAKVVAADLRDVVSPQDAVLADASRVVQYDAGQDICRLVSVIFAAGIVETVVDDPRDVDRAVLVTVLHIRVAVGVQLRVVVIGR